MATLACTETYGDVEKLIYRTVHRWLKRFGGEWEELMSTANEMFVVAYGSHDQGKSSFSTWLVNRIWQRFLDDQRQWARRNAHCPTVQLPRTTERSNDNGIGGAVLEEIPDTSCKPFQFREFASGLSGDAETVARLALEVPGELFGLVKARREQAGDARSMIANHLRGLGWTYNRITESFREMREALG